MACQLMGLSARTYQRWNQGGVLSKDKRLDNKAPVHNKSSQSTYERILNVLNLPEYSTLTPHEIVPTLLDKGIYIASESTFYRVMRTSHQLKHRRKSTSFERKKPKALKASCPNKVYSWDITYLSSNIKGQYYYLYMVMDIYSRKIVGWQVHHCESSSYAADLVEDIVNREKIDKNQLTIHSDNGSPMKGATLRAKMMDLAISPSYSRPRVSNNNPYSEALFKTVKYHYTFPETPFSSLNDARNWVDGFVLWYNNEHKHSAIKFVTPEQRHQGLDGEILAHRKVVIEQAKKDFPEKWNGRETRNLTPITEVNLNPVKEKTRGSALNSRLSQAA